MRKTISCFLALLLITPSLLSAQRWNAEEQEVLDHVKMCWTAWTEAVAQQDVTPWMEQCQPADDVTAWDTSSGVLWNLEFQGREFHEWVKGVGRYWWQAIQPLEIRVYDDTALIWFFVTLSIEDNTGTVTRIQQKRFEVFRHFEGGWHWTGAMVAAEEVGAPFRVVK